MSRILIDPAALEDTATRLRAVSAELAELGGSTSSACCCEMPGTISSYVDTELGAVGTSVGEAAHGYVAAAQDATTRAQLIANDQSLAGAMSAGYATAPATTSVATAGSSQWASTAGWLDGVTGDGSATPVETGGTAGWTAAMPAPTSTPFTNTTANWIPDMAANNAAPSAINTSGWINGIHGGPAGVGGGFAPTVNVVSSGLFSYDGTLQATTLGSPDIHVTPGGLWEDNAGHQTTSLGNVVPDASGHYGVIL